MNNDVMMDGKVGREHKKLNLGEIKLVVMVPHVPCIVS